MTPLSQKISDIVRHELGLAPSYNLELTATPPQVPGWDSIGWMKIILAIEKHFQIELDFEKLETVYNINQLHDLVENSLESKS